MSKRLLPCLICIAATLLCLASCKKSPKDNTKKNTYTSKITGIWLLTGPGCEEEGSEYTCSGIFRYFSFTALNDTEIAGPQPDTLKYVSTNTDLQTVTFAGNLLLYKSGYYDTLIYHYASNTIVYNYNYNGAGGSQYFSGSGDLQPITWPGVSEIKKYTDNIAGAKLLSGTLFDTMNFSYIKDSMAFISDTVTFTLINDSMIKYNKDYALINSYELHFKALNEQTQTIIFQTLHAPLNPVTTLTYNYTTDKITLEQVYRDNFFKSYIKLE